MDTNKTRRAAIAIFGAGAVAAFGELRPALATKGGGKTDTKTKTKTQSDDGGCKRDNDCPKDCTCENGGCYPEVEYENCVAFSYKEQTQVCETRYGRRKRVNCKKFRSTRNRQVCQNRNAKTRALLTTCTNNSVEFAYAQCEYLRVS